MKIIVSHDIDHLTVSEHKNDLIIPKIIVRGFIESMSGRISFGELSGRIKKLFSNQWQNIEGLMAFNKENDIPSTFFIGVANGSGLNYSIKTAQEWSHSIVKEGFDVGVHGIFNDSMGAVKKEYEDFESITRIKEFGIRMHYLNCDKDVIEILAGANYLFDSSTLGMENPYIIKGLWEFPLQIMDTHIIEYNARWQSRNLNQAVEATKIILDEALERRLSYFSILFHDIYFSDIFHTWKEWYVWLIHYLKDNRFEFISYRDAVKELEEATN